MLRANVGLSRKLTKDYNSSGYSITLENEITAPVSDPEAVIEQVKELFDLAEETLAQQIDRSQSEAAIASHDVEPGQQTPVNRNGNRLNGSNGNGSPSTKELKNIHLLADNGVLALVCPEDIANSFHTTDCFREWFYEISAMPFPEKVRKYNETILLGYKRKQPNVTDYNGYTGDWLDRWMQTRIVYRLPPGVKPRQFRKLEPTDRELSRLVAQSPLRFHIQQPVDKTNYCPRPPLSPGIGHRAMLLASGHIDGMISPKNEPPHIIRGTAAKDKYIASVDENEDEEGNATTRTVISERPRLVIRVLDSKGNITTLE